LLCWKIRTGFSKGVSEKRIKPYVDWFYDAHLMTHFKVEEQQIFPILSCGNKLVNKALSQHKRLRQLFAETDDISISLSLIHEELEKHICFEERVLFCAIQKIATETQLIKISKSHPDKKFTDKTDDPFWVLKK